MLTIFTSSLSRKWASALMLLAMASTALLPLMAEAHPPRHARAKGYYKNVDYDRYDRGYYRNDDRRWRRDDRPFFSSSSR
jgi:hypothetical protein